MTTTKNKLPETITDDMVKVRISIMLDMDVIKKAKFEADKQGIGYQTLINMVLRNYFINETLLDKSALKLLMLSLNSGDTNQTNFVERYLLAKEVSTESRSEPKKKSAPTKRAKK